VFVCQATAAAIEGIFETAPTQALRLKNVPGPYVARRILSERTERLPRPVHAAFVGRCLELEKIHQALRRTAPGCPVVLEVTGEPGIGKSRLVGEALRTFGEEVSSLICECVPHGKDVLLHPLTELVRRVCGVEVEDTTQVIEQKVARRSRRYGLESGDADALGYLLGVPNAIAIMAPLPFNVIRQRVFHALNKLVLAPGDGTLIVLFMDDVQWMDALSGEWLMHLAEQAQGARLVIILISRLHEKPEMKLPSPTVRLRVGPLPQRFRSELITGLLGESFRGTEMRAAVLDQARGNPLFIGGNCTLGETTGAFRRPVVSGPPARSSDQRCVPVPSLNHPVSN
jgi:predicted ATPase